MGQGQRPLDLYYLKLGSGSSTATVFDRCGVAYHQTYDVLVPSIKVAMPCITDIVEPHAVPLIITRFKGEGHHDEAYTSEKVHRPLKNVWSPRPEHIERA